MFVNGISVSKAISNSLMSEGTVNLRVPWRLLAQELVTVLLPQEPPVPDDDVVESVDWVEGEVVVVESVDWVEGEAVVVVVGPDVRDVVDESPVQSSSPLKTILMTLGSWPAKVIMYSSLSVDPAAIPWWWNQLGLLMVNRLPLVGDTSAWNT